MLSSGQSMKPRPACPGIIPERMRYCIAKSRHTGCAVARSSPATYIPDQHLHVNQGKQGMTNSDEQSPTPDTLGRRSFMGLGSTAALGIAGGAGLATMPLVQMAMAAETPDRSANSAADRAAVPMQGWMTPRNFGITIGQNLSPQDRQANRAAFAAALEDCSKNKKTLFLPRGDYEIEGGPIEVKDGYHSLRILGNDAKIKQFSDGEHVLKVGNCSNVVIDGVSLTYDKPQMKGGSPDA